VLATLGPKPLQRPNAERTAHRYSTISLDLTTSAMDLSSLKPLLNALRFYAGLQTIAIKRVRAC
jgi:hypothetical protein